jgi:hypothetical protein
MSLRLLPYEKRSSYPESRVLHGGSVWGKIKGFFGKANKWLKKTGLISKVAGVAGMVDPRFRAASGVASALGYGRYYRRVKSYRRGAKTVSRYTRKNRGSGRTGCGRRCKTC